jgi:hypothetical protein
MTSKLANRRKILDIVGFDLGPHGEVLWNPPEQDLEVISRNAKP